MNKYVFGLALLGMGLLGVVQVSSAQDADHQKLRNVSVKDRSTGQSITLEEWLARRDPNDKTVLIEESTYTDQDREMHMPPPRRNEP